VLSPKRNTGPNALRRGRVSVPHAAYFVTICVEPRLPVLIPDIAPSLLGETHRMAASAVWTLRCLTVMPDHLHLLFALGERLTLSQSIARLKTRTKSLLGDCGTDWQDNFYAHRLRPDDSVEATLRYIWLNPYQAGLISAGKNWP
jgi:putative transposase